MKEIKKNSITNFLIAPDDEIKAELEAMNGMEYNLHSESRSNDIHVTYAGKRTKTAATKGSLKYEKTLSKSDKMPVKVEKLEPDGHLALSLHGATIDELQNIIQLAGVTSEDKYKILEARDRLMRLKQVKSHSLETAKVTSGTCLDMCPEKERLMRESQRQVALYELLEGNEYKINHLAAVKQYSRSSADQEEPLAHELRPVKSLKMTMSYLLHEIMDLCEEEGTNLGEWYHFLWDRTRGIRKDITQQELCCLESVELVEQCARFHIVCSERLCAEELSVFDKKINSENLTKCLQSLKYMYHDLRVKGVTCKNEPEFRAYIILLNLNNSNFMSDLQQLPVFIQKSPEVQFAIKVYSSLESNNYYKFFKLVRNTTYLNACILLRYFNQVRVKALSIMVKAYCRTMSTAYPLYELLYNLGFEDENEAVYFCEQVGLNTSSDELYILLNRQNFCLPISNIQQGRARYLIESKRTSKGLTIGQCIAGGKMPKKSYKDHKPHCSFDMQGYLLPESINAEDQGPQKNHYNKSIQKEPEPKKDFLWQTQERNPSVTENNVSTSKSSSFSETIVSRSHFNLSTESQVFSPLKCEAQITSKDKVFVHVPSPLMQATGHFDTSILNVPKSESIQLSSAQNNIFSFGSVNKNTQTFLKPVFNFTQQNEVPWTSLTIALMPTTTSKSIFSGVDRRNIFAKPAVPSTIFESSQTSVAVTSKVNTEKSKKHEEAIIISEKEYSVSELEKTDKVENKIIQKLEEKKKMQEIDKVAEETLDELITELIHNYCSTIAKEEINKIAMYNTLSENMLTQIINEMCDTMLSKEIANYQRIHDIMERMKENRVRKYFHRWKCYVSKKKQQKEALDRTPSWLQKRSVDECARLLYREGQELVMQNMRKKRCIETVKNSFENNPEPIEEIIYAGIKMNQKILNAYTYTSANIFWKLVVSWPHLDNKPDLWYHKKIMNRYLYPDDYTAEPIIKSLHRNSYESLHICIRYFEGFIIEHHVYGTDAFLFIAAASEHVDAVVKRLTKNVLSKQKLMPVPLVFIILGTGNLHAHNETIVTELESLVESGYISKYNITSEKMLNERIMLDLTQSTISWLAVNRPLENPLRMDYLQNVCDVSVTEEFWLRIVQNAKFNINLARAIEEPNFLINLHNEAIASLIDMLLDPESLMYTKFPPEFNKFLKYECTLPCTYEHFDDAWKTEEYRVLVENVMSSLMLSHWSFSWPIGDIQTLHRSLIRYCQEVLPHSNVNAVSCDILNHLYFLSDGLQITSFADILSHIVKEKIRTLRKDLKVVYNKNHIKCFRTLPWWLKSNTFGEFISLIESNAEYFEKDISVYLEPIKKRRRLDTCNNSSIESDNLFDQFDSLAEFCSHTQNTIMEVHSASKRLENRLKDQKQQSQMLEEKIRNSILEGNDNNTYT